MVESCQVEEADAEKVFDWPSGSSSRRDQLVVVVVAMAANYLLSLPLAFPATLLRQLARFARVAASLDHYFNSSSSHRMVASRSHRSCYIHGPAGKDLSRRGEVSPSNLFLCLLYTWVSSSKLIAGQLVRNNSIMAPHSHLSPLEIIYAMFPPPSMQDRRSP